MIILLTLEYAAAAIIATLAATLVIGIAASFAQWLKQEFRPHPAQPQPADEYNLRTLEYYR